MNECDVRCITVRGYIARRLLTDWRNEEFIELINSAVNGFCVKRFCRI